MDTATTKHMKVRYELYVRHLGLCAEDKLAVSAQQRWETDAMTDMKEHTKNCCYQENSSFPSHLWLEPGKAHLPG